MPEPTIGQWTESQLMRVIQNLIRLHPPESAVNLTVDEVTITEQLTCEDQLQFLQHRTAVGAAGSASALPATPAGYIPILDYAGQVKVIPYYNT